MNGQGPDARPRWQKARPSAIMTLLSKPSQRRKGWIVKGIARPGLAGKPQVREMLILAVLAAVALVIAWTLAGGGAAQAGPLLQDSPLAPPQEQQSPLPTAAPGAEPAPPAPTATPVPEPAAPAAVEPPVPIGVLLGVMAVIAVAALIIGLRRR